MVSKKTVNEVLEAYLEEKGVPSENIVHIIKSLHKSILNDEKAEEEKEKSGGGTQTMHGTSCPRIMNKYGRLVTEM